MGGAGGGGSGGGSERKSWAVGAAAFEWGSVGSAAPSTSGGQEEEEAGAGETEMKSGSSGGGSGAGPRDVRESGECRCDPLRGRHTLSAGSRGAGSRHLGTAQPGVEGKQPNEGHPWLFEPQHLIDVLCAAFSSMRSMKELVQDVKMKNEVFKAGVKLSSKSNGTYTKVQIAESIVKCRPDSVTNAHELLSWLVVSCVNSNVAGLVL